MEKADLIYLAGLLDADGWFSVQRSRYKGGAYTYSASVGIANTNRELISWLATTFGGKIRERRPNPGQLGSKMRYEWRPRLYEIRKFLPLVLEYLKVKKRQAELLLELLDTANTRFRGRGVPLHVQEKREAIYQALRVLNNTNHKIVKVPLGSGHHKPNGP